MKVGLFFGSFNPVHIGHLALANYIVEYSNISQLWFVVSPHNPLKKKETLLMDQSRLELLEAAIENEDRFRISNIEFSMPKPSYTIDTLTYLSEKFPHEFSLIMGADCIPTFHKWKNHEIIVEKYERIIYPRIIDNDGVDYSKLENAIVLENAPKIEISSSFIRTAIKEGKNMKYLLPPKVWEIIDKYNYYR